MSSYSKNSPTSLQLHRRTDPQIGQQRVSGVIAGMPQTPSYGGWVVVHTWEGGGFIAWGLSVATKLLISGIFLAFLWIFMRGA